MIQIVGDKEILEALRALPRELNHKVMGSLHFSAAKPLIAKEKQLAPFDTGDLRNSIGAYKVPMNRATEIGNVIVGPRRGGGFKGYHGHLVEFGTRARYTKKGAYRGIMPAQPFARPAFEATKGQVEELIASGLSIATVRILKKYIK